jgi:hypothetical protein
VKTISLKKVSAVAVASLGLGLLSVVPAQAAYITLDVSSINLKQSTAAPVTSAVVAVNVGATIPSATRVVGNQAMFQAALTSYPAGGFVSVSGKLGPNGETANTNATYPTGWAGTAVAGAGNGQLELVASATTAGSTVTSTATTGFGSFVFTPTKVGTYTLTVWHDTTATPDLSLGATEVRQTIEIVVAAEATLAPSLSTAFMTTPSANGATASSTTNAIARSAYKTKDTGIAQIKVTLNKSDATADTAAHTITATVSGAGFVKADQIADTPGSVATRTATVSTGGNAGVNYIHINSDGTAGSGTVTVTVTHAVTGVTTTLGTFSYTSYDDVTNLAVSTTNATIGKAGSTTGRSIAARTTAGNLLGVLDGTSTVPAFIVKATDSAGRVANTVAAPSVVSLTSPAVATGGTCTLDDGSSSTASSSTNGIGYYNCNFATFSGAKSAEKATLTIRIVDPADATKYISTTFDVTVGGSVSTEVISLDKLAYAPGEGMVVTRTGKDSSGNPVADGSASPAVTFSKAVGGTAPAAGFYKGGASASSTSAATASVFAPVVPGAFSAIATSGATGNPTITSASSVTDANAGLLTQIDALNAKIVALNALIAKIMKKLGVK